MFQRLAHCEDFNDFCGPARDAAMRPAAIGFGE
jgi:hypothetical protein